MGLILDYTSADSSDHRKQLLRVIRSVRRRWRLKVFLRGLAIVLSVALAAFLVAAFAMDHFRFSSTAVLVFRVFAYAAVLGVLVRYLIVPLWRRVSDERVALYLEEHEPSLETGVLSAVEFADRAERESDPASRALVRRLVENAVERCAGIDYGRRVERSSLRRSWGLLAGAGLVALILVLLAPPFVRHSSRYLLFPVSRGGIENPYSIQVEPGNTRVARGADLKVAARLQNFESDEVDIAVRRGASGAWERWTMTRAEETGDYLFFLFGLEEETQYLVEASGVRSPLYRIEVAELPYVSELRLEYHYPAYTGLSPRVQEQGGDIAALRGTEVRLQVTPTIPVAGAAIVLEAGDTLPLAPSGQGTLNGSLTVTQEGLYRIVFETDDGDRVVGSPDYFIDPLDDQPPSVRFEKPGRDIKVTSIEEVFSEVEAEDDYGLARVELIYSLNGGPRDTVVLYGGRDRRRAVTAGHTFYLEEFDLVPGDFLSYYARAADASSGDATATTDIYFMEVRPYDREFRQSQSSPTPGAAGFNSSLSEQQRQIVAATFKMVRDRESYSEQEYEENLATLALAQGRLREEVETLVRRIQTRGVAELDSSFSVIAEALPIAASEMAAAEEQLGEREPEAALPPEQRALQQLQRAEAAFREVQVSQGAPGGGGGESNMEELSELFELELDKLRNQYESVERDQRRQVDNEIDETLQKLEELSRRQQQENERMRARAERMRGRSGGGGGANQRRLAEETEELARKLERLSREESQPDLQETARELREAAEEMRRAAANSSEGGASQGRSALDRLRQARRLLDEKRGKRLDRAVEDALRRAQRLAEEQREVTSDIEELSSEPTTRARQLRRLVERKEEMAEDVADLEAELDRLSRESRREQRDVSEKLGEAANSIRENKLKELLRYSRGVVQQRSREYARNFEERISGAIGELEETLEEARGAVGEASREDRLAETLEETRDLVQSLESLEARTRERGGERAAEQGSEGRSAEREQGARSQGGEQPGGEQQKGQQQGGERQGGQQAAPGETSSERSGQQGEARNPRAASPSGPGGAPIFRRGEARQLRREFQERRGEAERLREQLEAEGIDTSELENVIGDLRQLEQQDFGDPRGLAELQASIIQDLKEFEFTLRRQLEGDEERELLLTGSDDVPEGYRELVEEYYRRLAEKESRN